MRKTLMKKYIFAALCAGGLFGLYHSRMETSAYAAEGMRADAPKNLSELRSADGAQLDVWAQSLSAFDGRTYGYITPEKNQLDKNICWAYAAIGAAEASILREGIDPSADKDNLDLDEYVAAYLSFNRDGRHDPLFLTANDRFSGDWNQGAYAHDVFAAMSQGFSPVDQKTTYDSGDEEIASFVSESEYFVQSYLRIPNDEASIKRAILQYGAVTIEYRSPGGNNPYLYYSKGEATNHASVIVGWDDGIDSNLFYPDKPSANGAWIVKNSWGPYGMDKGTGVYCYYLSYRSFLTDNIYAVDLAKKEDYPNLYYYDGQLETSMRSYAAEAQAAVYEAKLSTSSLQEQLSAVTVVSGQSDLDANIKIYRRLSVNPGNVNDDGNEPTGGDLSAELSVRLDRPGLHTIDLETPLDLDQGEYFSIVVSCTNAYHESVPLPCAVDGGGSVNDMTYRFSQGVWTSYKDSFHYADTSSDNMSARIRAVTRTVPREKDLGNDLHYARVEIENRLLFYERGKEQIPDLKVFFGDKQLREGSDYTVSLKDNVTPGTATVILRGAGDYFGTRETAFEVAKRRNPPNFMSGTVEVYRNTVRLHQVPIPVDWEWIDRDCDLEYGLTPYPVSLRYVGEDRQCYQLTTCDFYVNRIDSDPPDLADLSEADVKIGGEYTYTGKPVVPSVDVVFRGFRLHEGVDYAVTCEDNTDAGQAALTVTGIGAYRGSVTLSFAIGKAERRAFSVSQEDWTFGDPALPSVSGEEEDAAVSYLYASEEEGSYRADPPQNAGVYWIKAIIGESKNFRSAESKAKFTVLPKDLSGCRAAVEAEGLVYTGSAIEPPVSVTDGGEKLTEGTDYAISYVNNVNAGGAAMVLLRGIGNYTGALTALFAIGKAAASAIDTTIHVQSFESLPDIALPEGFVWEEDSLTALSDCVLKATARYTGGNYAVDKVEFEIVSETPVKPLNGGNPLIWPAVTIPAAVVLAALVLAAVILVRRKRP